MVLIRYTAKLYSSVGVRRLSHWSNIKMAPPDKILGLTESFKADTFQQKINLGVGAYRDEKGKPFVLKSVREAEKRIFEKGLDKEYAGIAGVPGFVKKSLEFGYGENSPVLAEGRVAAVQSISGTGGCRLVGQFISRFFGVGEKIYVPNPTWGNHLPIMRDSGLEPVYYRYYDKSENTVDFTGMIADIKAADDESVFMFHACAHNPTGCDPTPAQWDELSKVMKEKSHIVFFDCAYQGFASGDPEADAYAVRKFVADGHNIILCQSYAKNFGLYGERVGLLSVVADSKLEADIVNSQLKVLARPMYSNPPIHGAHIVAEVLSDPQLKSLWSQECKAMADRIGRMRKLLRDKLEPGQSKSWKHVTDQIGMFCYTGLTPDQVRRLKEEFHIYCTEDGRFSMAGINDSNIDYLAESVKKVL